MANDEKQRMGDGNDNYVQAAKQAANAVKQSGQAAAKQAAAKGAEAAANAAAAAVKAGAETGKAVSEIAAGTAAGGPWGAIISAAWAARHTLFKILVCTCLGLLFLITLVVSLPSIIADKVFGLNGTKPQQNVSLTEIYSELAETVSEIVNEGYNLSLAETDKLITDGGYDRELSEEALINYAHSSAGFDVCYILAAYSASMGQKNTSGEDMAAKLRSVAGDMFPVTYTEKQVTRVVPVSYSTYKQVSVVVVTGRKYLGRIDGVPQYSYTTETRTYYLPDELKTSDRAITVPKYRSVTVTVPIYGGGRITGTQEKTYYEPDGTETLTPASETVKYIECTINQFNSGVIAAAFGLDLAAPYNQFNITYGEAIQNMADALKMTMYGALASGQQVPLTDAELTAFVNAQDCSDTRKLILTTALSLVGRVPYFWGGKSGPGWNDEWNTPRLVTSEGSPSTGTIRPYGMDCSGFSNWVFNTALGIDIGAGCVGQYPNTFAVSASELLPGDLGFLSKDGKWSHVLIFAGYGENGERMWVHCSSSAGGVTLNSPKYEGSLSYRRLSIVDYDAPAAQAPGEP